MEIPSRYQVRAGRGLLFTFRRSASPKMHPAFSPFRPPSVGLALVAKRPMGSAIHGSALSIHTEPAGFWDRSRSVPDSRGRDGERGTEGRDSPRPQPSPMAARDRASEVDWSERQEAFRGAAEPRNIKSSPLPDRTLWLERLWEFAPCSQSGSGRPHPVVHAVPESHETLVCASTVDQADRGTRARGLRLRGDDGRGRGPRLRGDDGG